MAKGLCTLLTTPAVRGLGLMYTAQVWTLFVVGTVNIGLDMAHIYDHLVNKFGMSLTSDLSPSFADDPGSDGVRRRRCAGNPKLV